jgi:hypothetical protein
MSILEAFGEEKARRDVVVFLAASGDDVASCADDFQVFPQEISTETFATLH